MYGSGSEKKINNPVGTPKKNSPPKKPTTNNPQFFNHLEF